MRSGLRHRLLNLLHSALLLAGMGLIAWICTDAFAGFWARIWVLAGLVGGLLVAPSVPKRVLLSAYAARPLSARNFPDGVALVRRLALKAGLPCPPDLYYVPSSVANAFALGRRGDSAIALSDGLLRLLDRRELAGVLAHEISHIARGDLWLMALADMMTRATALMSLTGQLVLVINLPLLLLGLVTVPWTVPVILVLAPTLMSLLQLALSRAREFDADLGAADLTGDPAGLASALLKLERRAGGFWAEILLPARRIPEPSLLRTHPPAARRVARLRALAQDRPDAPSGPEQTDRMFPRAFPAVHRPPRMRWTGFWY